MEGYFVVSAILFGAVSGYELLFICFICVFVCCIFVFGVFIFVFVDFYEFSMFYM